MYLLRDSQLTQSFTLKCSVHTVLIEELLKCFELYSMKMEFPKLDLYLNSVQYAQ